MKALFVYYKVAPVDHAPWRARVEGFQEQLSQAWPGLQAELMQRPEPSAEAMETWMEIYRHPHGVDEQMQAAIAQLALDLDLPGKRAVEVFIPLQI
ncbi:MAG: DUF4936 family protein [Burkholderiaceae bacterium]